MTFSFVGIEHVQLAAPKDCEERARIFFGQILGLAEIEKPSALKGRGGVWFQCGLQQLHIGVQHDFVAAIKAHPAFELTGLDLLRERLLAYHIAIVEDDARTDEGVSRFYVADPFGNRLEFMEKQKH